MSDRTELLHLPSKGSSELVISDSSSRLIARTLHDISDLAKAWTKSKEFTALDPADAEAQFRLGEEYRWGEERPQDYSKAATCFRKAADQGHAKAQHSLAWLYRTGHGVSQDFQESAFFDTLAANQGLASAQYTLSQLYARGDGVPRDPAERLKWCRIAADQGYWPAELSMALMHDAESQEDLQVAAFWYSRLAEKGDWDAQNRLGEIYEKGHGVPQDFGRAASLYRGAADNGFAEAQFNLSGLYSRGDGVPQSYTDAAIWCRKAADQGHYVAQFILAASYMDGTGVPQDYVEAYFWLELAVRRRTTAEQDDYSPLRDSVVERLTPDQISEHAARAEGWLAAHPPKP